MKKILLVLSLIYGILFYSNANDTTVVKHDVEVAVQKIKVYDKDTKITNDVLSSLVESYSFDVTEKQKIYNSINKLLDNVNSKTIVSEETKEILYSYYKQKSNIILTIFITSMILTGLGIMLNIMNAKGSWMVFILGSILVIFSLILVATNVMYMNKDFYELLLQQDILRLSG